MSLFADAKCASRAVSFKRIEGAGLPMVGYSYRVVPIDHPNAELNMMEVLTSKVEYVGEDGSFTTRNTIYNLAKA